MRDLSSGFVSRAYNHPDERPAINYSSEHDRQHIHTPRERERETETERETHTHTYVRIVWTKTPSRVAWPGL